MQMGIIRQIDPASIHRLLIRSTNWVGDAVMTTPAIRAMRDHFNASEITILAKPWVAPLFESSEHVDHVLIYDDNGVHRGLTGLIRLVREIKTRRFDAAVLLQNAFEAALIAFLSGIPCRIGYPTDVRRWLLTHPVSMPAGIKRVHQTAYYLGILGGIGIREPDSSLYLKLSPQLIQSARSILRNHDVKKDDTLVGINPTATFGPAKQWFPESFAKLADRLSEELKCRILIFGGPEDRDLGAKISKMMRRPQVNLSGKTRLDEAMGLIAACRLFVTNDSGLMHVAAALKVPLVAIFGSTNPVTTGPCSDRAQTVQTTLDCSPCLKPDCPEGHLDCMRQIDVDSVMNAVKAVW